MIAKINFDGKDHLAVVFDHVYNYDELVEIRNSITTILGVFDGIFDESGLQSERAYAHKLLEMLSPNVEQSFEMMCHYFGSEHTPKNAVKKPCEIYI